MRRWIVLVDDKEVGTLRRGDALEVAVEEGEHLVQVRARFGRSAPLAVMVGSGADVHLTCGPAASAIAFSVGWRDRGPDIALKEQGD
jgi:hypothetical protein